MRAHLINSAGQKIQNEIVITRGLTITTPGGITVPSTTYITLWDGKFFLNIVRNKINGE